MSLGGGSGGINPALLLGLGGQLMGLGTPRPAGGQMPQGSSLGAIPGVLPLLAQYLGNTPPGGAPGAAQPTSSLPGIAPQMPPGMMPQANNPAMVGRMPMPGMGAAPPMPGQMGPGGLSGTPGNLPVMPGASPAPGIGLPGGSGPQAGAPPSPGMPGPQTLQAVSQGQNGAGFNSLLQMLQQRLGFGGMGGQ